MSSRLQSAAPRSSQGRRVNGESGANVFVSARQGETGATLIGHRWSGSQSGARFVLGSVSPSSFPHGDRKGACRLASRSKRNNRRRRQVKTPKQSEKMAAAPIVSGSRAHRTGSTLVFIISTSNSSTTTKQNTTRQSTASH